MTDVASRFVGVYDQLRALADQRLRRGGASSTLQPTALVHEVYVRMARQDPAAFADREHFLAVAATAMRQVLVDRARRRGAVKRGGEWSRVTLDEGVMRSSDRPVDVLELDRAITELAERSPRHARVVELRVFAGMTVPEAATILGVSVTTVEKDWRYARAWIRAQLHPSV